MARPWLLPAVAAGALFCPAAWAQSLGNPSRYPVDPTLIPRPSLRAERVDDPIRVDGHLTEAAWSRADSTNTAFIQVQPSPGYPASERTVVRILYDKDRLYIGATLYESEPEKLIVPGLEQDFATTDSDILGIGLDTYHDRQNGFLFAVNPAGALWDAQTFNDQRDVVMAWEGVVDVRTSIGDDRWTVEMAIPFSTLRYNPMRGEQVWGLSFSRRIRHLNEESNWAPTERQYKLYKFSLAGTLTGLRELRTTRNLWVKPYVLGSHLSGAAPAEPGGNGDAGLDVKWGLTPRLTLDLTTRTDFSQVEVDAEQVNLTRFSLFFPEKRDFFLENEGIFSFQDVTIRNYRTGSSPRNFKLYHSRRIGLSPSRTPIDIAGGARLTGKLGDRFEIGLIDMQTLRSEAPGDEQPFPAENFAVARLRALLGSTSNVGAMFVNREQTGGGSDGYNRSFGVDGNFTLVGKLVLSAYGAHTEDASPTGDSRDAGMLQAAWRGPLWDVSFLAKHIGNDFDPGLGFVDRVGVRRYFATVGAHPQVSNDRIFELNPYVDVDVYTNLEGTLETREVTPAFSVHFTDGGILTLSASDRVERLFEGASIAGVLVAPGRYGWREGLASYRVSGSHLLSGTFSVSGGDFYDGRRLSFAASTRFRPTPRFTLDAGVQHNDLELADRSFTADLYSARLRWAHDVRTFLMGFVQYNEATEELITNVRFNLIHAPLSDLFLVYTERRSLADGVGEALLERGLTLKATKLFAF
jgi:hypothetical protein